MKVLSVFFMVSLFLIFGCERSSQISSYPDCFENKQSTVKSTGGCGTVFLFAQFDSSHLVAINLKGEELGLGTTCQTFDIKDHLNNISIQYLTHNNHPDSLYFNYCTDFIPHPYVFGQIKAYDAVSGQISVVVSQDSDEWEICEGFKSSVQLQNVLFRERKSGKQGPPPRDTLIEELLIVDEWVGTCSG